MTIGFIGLGRMGSGIVRNLLRAGHSLIVYNRTRSRAEELAAEGAQVADSPAGVCEAGIVLTMVADDEALTNVTLGARGILAALRPGTIHASHSTIGIALAKRLTAEHTSSQQTYVSAPVFGRPEAAANAQLIVVAAGESGALDRLKPVFDAIGRKSIVVGEEPWQANALKLCGNFMLALMIEAFGEAFATMRKSGVEPRTFLDAMTGLFRSPVYEMYGGIIAEQRFDPAGFALKLGLKDVRLALRAADEVGSPMPFASILHDQFLAAMANGQSDLDWSSLTKIAARNAGLKE
jgi:3-hydroxyisobutyrate dehydrogenase-like beta-hydroxyacid dehydrogenase